MARTYFSEEQRFSESPMIYVFLVVATLGIAGIAVGFTQEIAASGGNMQEMIIPIFACVLIFFLVGWMLFSLKLETYVSEKQIRYRMPPLARKAKTIDASEIEQANVITYSAIQNYRGWGLRHSIKHGRGYTIYGNKGLKIVLKSGAKILLGTQKPQLMERAVKHLMENREDYG